MLGSGGLAGVLGYLSKSSFWSVLEAFGLRSATKVRKGSLKQRFRATAREHGRKREIKRAKKRGCESALGVLRDLF